MDIEKQERDVLARIVGVADGEDIVSARICEEEHEPENAVAKELHDESVALEKYLEGLGEQINQMHVAMMRQDLALLEDTVEALKRGAGSYGLMRIAAMADRLDDEIAHEDDLVHLVSRVDELCDVCKELMEHEDEMDDDLLPGA